MEGMDFNGLAMLVQMAIVAMINGLADVVGNLAQALPNPDPFPELITGLEVDTSSVGATAYWFISEFVDIATIGGIFLAWIPMFALGWIWQFIWNLFKVKNKG